MSDFSIRVENLSKRYRIGLEEEKHETLLGSLSAWVRSPMRNYRRLRSLSRFEENEGPQADVLWALRDISFEMKPGEVLGVIGRNGAGKSTLLKILSRITEPTQGRVILNGRVSSLLEVGTGFHPELTGRENIYLNGTILGMRKSEVDRKFDEIVAFSGVEKFIDTPVKRYSSGMKVRLAFSVAAHLEPEVLMIDEVLAVGDAEFQKKCLGKMDDVRRSGRTVLFVSHDMAAIRALCPRTILLENGAIVRDDETEHVIGRYFREGGAIEGPSGVVLTDEHHGTDTSQLITFKSWSVTDNIHGEGNKVGSGNSCVFRISYQLAASVRELSNVSVALTIKDDFGEPLLSGATRFVNADFARLSASGTIVCRFGSLPLIPGLYRVHLWCSVNGEPAAVVRNGGKLEVVADDVFGTGHLPQRRNHGVFIIREQSWEFEPFARTTPATKVEV